MLRRTLLCLALLAAAAPGLAWNATGHRLVALIAWQQLTPASRQWLAATLADHPDQPRWLARARPETPADVFAEAATWADAIRHDPRYFDAEREAPLPPPPGLPDGARHRDWHYVDLDAAGRPLAGQIDRVLPRLAGQLASGGRAERAYALPWLLHLVGDIHQPLHVGRAGDDGGNAVEIEVADEPRRPFTRLHAYWDELPGPGGRRGRRLDDEVAALLAAYRPPPRGDVAAWRDESHRRLAAVYPAEAGSLLPLVDAAYRQRAERLAGEQLVAAGYRLGWLLEEIVSRRVSRGTARPSP